MIFNLRRKRNRPLMVAVLGSGPAGLFAAQAVYDMGHVVKIYSKGEKSTMYGAQYLHQPIPGLSLTRPERIDYVLKGTIDGYRRKVYGDMEVSVSPESLAGQHDAWNIREAYDNAWERFHGLIQESYIDNIWLQKFAGANAADLVVWSIPLRPQCYQRHPFGSQDVWAQGDAPELGMYCSVNVEPWTVVTNGEETPHWYRASNVFGHRTAEWPSSVRPPVSGIARVTKPILNYCDCYLELGGAPVLRVGRYGRWMKGELSHHAYLKTREVLERM